MPVAGSIDTAPPALRYLSGQWYFTGPEQSAIGRIVETSDTYAKVQVHRLSTPGALETEEDRIASTSHVSGQYIRNQIDETRRSLGKPALVWSDITREAVGISVEEANALPVTRWQLRRDEAEALEAARASEAELSDTAGAPSELTLARKDIAPYSVAIKLLPHLDEMLGEFEDDVRLAGLEDHAPDFLERLQKLPIPSLAGYEGTMKRALANPDSRRVQDALFAAVGACQAEIRRERRMPGAMDIIEEIQEPAEVVRERQHRIHKPADGVAQGDLITGEFAPVKNATLGRPRYLLTQEEVPDEDVVTVVRLVTGLGLPDLSVRDARVLLRPFLKSKDGSQKVRALVAKIADGRGPADLSRP